MTKLDAVFAQVKVCRHMGEAVPGQPGCGCEQRLRDCSEFGTCSFGPSPAPAWCRDTKGAIICPLFEEK